MSVSERALLPNMSFLEVDEMSVESAVETGGRWSALAGGG